MNKSQSLYELESNFLSLMEMADEDGNFPKEISEALEITEKDIATKLDNYAKFIKHLEAIQEGRKKEVQRLEKMNASNQNTINSLKGRIEIALNLLTSDGKFKTGTFRFSKGNSSSAAVMDIAAVPEDYIRNKPEPDKKKMLEDLKAGKEIPGVELKTSSFIKIL